MAISAKALDAGSQDGGRCFVNVKNGRSSESMIGCRAHALGPALLKWCYAKWFRFRHACTYYYTIFSHGLFSSKLPQAYSIDSYLCCMAGITFICRCKTDLANYYKRKHCTLLDLDTIQHWESMIDRRGEVRWTVWRAVELLRNHLCSR